MWRGFDFGEHWLAIRAGLLTSLLVPLLWAGGLCRCQRLLDALRWSPRHDSAPPTPQVQRLADVIGFGCRRYSLLPAACLARSLSLQHLLARRGIDTSLCIGSRLERGEFSAHAWVEYRGVPLAETQAPREIYAAFER